MEWLKELLKKAGLDDVKIDELIGDIGKALPEHFVPKSRYNEVAEAKKKAEEALKDRDKQLEDLKKSAGNNDELKKQIETLQAENKAAKEKYEAELMELRLTTAVKLAIAGQVHDPDIVAGLLDKSKIELDDAGNIKSGLDEQIKALQQNKAFLFIQKEPDKGPQFKGVAPADGREKSNGQPQPQSLADAVAAYYNKS